MNLGSIPGYYYDTEKKKYFKVQADHLLPSDAQYSKGNVSRESRKAKRARSEQRRADHRKKETVQRSKVLQSRVVGRIGLQRESGGLKTSASLDDADAALVAGMVSRRFKARTEEIIPSLHEIPLDDVHYLPEANEAVMVAFSNSSEYVFGYNLFHFNWATSNGSIGFQGRKPPARKRIYLRSLNIKRTHRSKVVFCASSQLLALVAYPENDLQHYFASEREHLLNGPPSIEAGSPYPPHAAFIRPGSTDIVVRGERNLDCLKIDQNLRRGPVWSGKWFDEDDAPSFCASVDSLNPLQVAYVDNSVPTARAVKLWDIRTPSKLADNNTAVLFPVQQRVTGVRTADDSERRLLVSTNHSLSLYDTRSGRKPYLTFEHVHQEPDLQFATNRRGVVAAVDRDNLVQVYSTWTGLRLGTLNAPHTKSPGQLIEKSLIRNLKWYDDRSEGPVLMACQGDTVVKWSWQGAG